MRVKRYVVDSMPNALQKIRSELGKDAVILNTKEVRLGGFLGMFAKKKIEVIAAIETNRTTNPTNPKVDIVNTPTDNHSKEVETTERSQSTSSSVAVMTRPETEKNDSIEKINNSHEDKILQEIQQMKAMFLSLNKESEFQSLPIELRKLEERLLQQEIAPEIIQQMFFQIKEKFENKHDDEKIENPIDLLKEQLKNVITANTSKPLQKETKLVHFVGPTGVGKTTTIAKLAAEQVLKENRKVGFITSDTYRIAAVEQLKTYANILNIPLEVVFSPQDLNQAFEKLKDRDIIFMDTAGRNYKNEMYVSELNTLLQSDCKSETFLVLSMTSKYEDMKDIAENFKHFKIDKVLFTKLDETNTYGAMINLIHDSHLKLSYVTTGQNVPDDIKVINEDDIINLLLGDDSHD